MNQRGVSELLIDSALDPELLNRLRHSPDGVFGEYGLTDEQRDILRSPDHRLLGLLGEALAKQEKVPAASQPVVSTQTALRVSATARNLPGVSLVVTVLPCAHIQNGQPVGVSYAAWVNPLAPGTDPASLPPPPGAVFPGQPLTPAHIVMQLSAVQTQDTDGNLQVGLWATLKQSSNVEHTALQALPTPDAVEVSDSVTAVREAAPEERYTRLVELMRTLRIGGDA
ncbi:MAG: hypothetical protein H7Y20_03260 [Bryobacteraceae bacterium]|nr:hypothetical protein [Bryobacteraceae bacterium]